MLGVAHPKVSERYGKILAAAKKLDRDSKYRSSFDYSIYDQLAARFGAQQPRGGVVFKSFMKLLQAQDCRHCFYRFEIDTYGRGCTFNCAYCYAKSYLSIRRYWNEPFPMPLDLSEVRKIFYTIFETDRRHKFRRVMEMRVPLRIGSMSDAFMHIDKKYKVTQELLRILKFYRYPYIIFTRSDLIAEEPYLSLLDPALCSVQLSLSSINDALVRQIEPGAPSPLRRLKALQTLSENGFWTTVRINPLFPIYPDGYYTNPKFDRSTAKAFPYFSWDMVDVIAAHKIPSLLVGIARLYPPNMRFLKKALGYDLRSIFPSDVKEERAALHFSEAETAYYYQRIQDLCHKAGVRFSTCYIGNDPSGDSFFRYQNLWSNKADCCDAKGNVPAFQTTCASLRTPTPSSTALH
jgi:DNA repair photolyase